MNGWRRYLSGLAFALWGVLCLAPPALADMPLVETPALREMVTRGLLPPVGERLPGEPLIVDLEAQGKEIGVHGGDIVTIVARARDIRYLSAYSYARLVGYDADLKLQPDLLAGVEVEDERRFTLRLRPGHRWSDGHPFTSEDIRYWWEDVALSKDLSPGGPPDFMRVNEKLPRFEVVDPQTVRFSWEGPNPRFLPALAMPRDPFIYRPAHYLKRFHARYTPKAELDALAAKQKLRSWAALHNRLDDMFENSNPDLPTLQPWKVATAAPASRFLFERNPFYHRVDRKGQQLPYLDRIVIDVASGGLMAAKANAGEADLVARGLSMSDIPILKQGEASKGYRTLMWPIARGSEIALFPNLNTVDPAWRKLNRDVRFRRALSLAIDRRTLNNALLFGLGVEGNNTVREGSALFRPELRSLNATYDPKEAARLLDEIGLTGRDPNGARLLPDGRPLEIVVEVDGESGSLVDGLELIGEFWREVGVRLFVKPQERTILRNRSFSGLTVMVAAQGLDNAVPTPIMSPWELAPISQSHYAWPMWGQFVETSGKNGEKVDMPEAQRLMELFRDWKNAGDEPTKAKAWGEMLSIHADQQFTIGTVAGALQPIVRRNGLANVPLRAVYSWEPGSLIGIYRMDAFFWSDPARRESRPR